MLATNQKKKEKKQQLCEIMDILSYDVTIYACIKTSSCMLQIQKTFICQSYHNKAEKKKSSQAICIMKY